VSGKPWLSLIREQIDPFRVHAIYQRLLTLPRAGFDLLLALDGIINLLEFLVIQQLCHPVTGGKTKVLFASVLQYSLLQVTCHAGIKHCVILIGQDVNVVAALHV
jgi:hypothetical protein